MSRERDAWWRRPAQARGLLALALALAFLLPYLGAAWYERRKAGQWAAGAMSGYEIDEWQRVGVRDVQTAVRWRNAGFKPPHAALWRDEGFGPDEARLFDDAGFGMGTARIWKKHGFPAAEAVEWHAHGFYYPEAAEWKRLGVSPAEAKERQAANKRRSR